MSQAKSIKPVSHVIFDLDGTIVNTEKVYEAIFEDIVNSYNKTISQDLRLKYIGLPGKTACEIIAKELEIPVQPEELNKQLKEKAVQLISDVELMPGAERLIRHLSEKKIPIAIATNSEKDAVRLKFKNHRELYNLFHHVVCGDDVPKQKPDPDVYLKAAEMFDGKIAPQSCLAIEDSVVGVAAAKLAGMQVLMVPSKLLPNELSKDACLVIKSLDEFKPEIFGLPKF
jgi:pseudouridine-5'-monophosphatase